MMVCGAAAWAQGLTCPLFIRGRRGIGGRMPDRPDLVALYHAAQAYSALGAVVAAAFLWAGVSRVAPLARGSYAFRPLLVPGLVLLWPLVLWRWWRLAGSNRERVALGRRFRATHRLVWIALAALLPLALLAALSLRQPGPLEAAPIRLAPPGATP